MTHRCKHVDAIKEVLREEGARDITVTREGNAIRIDWTLGGRRSHVTAGVQTRDPVAAGNVGRQAARRACREMRPS